MRYNKIKYHTCDLTQDTIWESDKNSRKRHTQKSQEVSPFPAGDHKAGRKRQDSMTDMKHKEHKGSTKEVLPWKGQ